MRGLLLALLISLPTGASAQQAERLIEQLSDPSWKVRQQATRRLIRMGRTAVPALRRAIAEGNRETRWRAQAALNRILPGQHYLEALCLADRGKLAEAIARIRPILEHLPADTRPTPSWALGILEEVRDMAPGGKADLGRGIAYHNLHCLLREAGINSGRMLEKARREYRQLLPDNRRAARLLAVLDWERGDRRAAEKHWKIGKPTAAELKSFWTLYDVASYKAVQGKTKEALEVLARAISRSETARREARVASDFHMLRGLPAFEALVGNRPKK